MTTFATSTYNPMVREQIRIAIEQSDWTQSAFSKEVGVAPSNLNAFLNGARTLPYDKLVAALDSLSLTIGAKSQGASIFSASELPEIFRIAMDDKGYNSKDVVDKTGLNESCFSTFLNGQRKMPLRNIEKVMDCLGLGVVKYIGAR